MITDACVKIAVLKTCSEKKTRESAVGTFFFFFFFFLIGIHSMEG